jgi:DNA-binding winged helix-turn-helix (wHTH) protein
MQHRPQRRTLRRAASHARPRRWAAMPTSTCLPRYEPARPGPTNAETALEFGRFRVPLRRRQLFADGVPVELGTRAFELLLALLEADGALVTKDELLSRVWPGIVVAEENLKVQVSALRKALGEDRDVIRTEVGRGYRFTGVLRSHSAAETGQVSSGAKPRSGPGWFPANCLVSLRHSLRSS